MRRLLVALVVPAVMAGTTLISPAARAQTPSVGVKPYGTPPDDPNGGQWFTAEVPPGGTAHFVAEVTNPARVAQTIRMYLADLDFLASGAAKISSESEDIGTWGVFERTEASIPAGGRELLPFSVRVPTDAVPGDHVGVFVVEHSPEQAGDFKTVRRVATRLYVTLPGDAPKDVTIEKVDVKADSWFFPREATVTTTLRNSGRVRLNPTVTVNESPAKGPGLLMSRSREPYVATLKVPFWAGLLRYRIDVATTAGSLSGPARSMRVSKFLFPWHLVALLALMAGVVWTGRWVWRKRGSKYESIRSDIRRIERLLAGQAAVNGPGGGSEDPATAIRSAIKQARRAGDDKTVGRLKAKLDKLTMEPEVEITAAEVPPAGGNAALEAILRQLAGAPASERPALIKAARAFPKRDIEAAAALLESLPEDVRMKVLAPRTRKTKAPTAKSTKRP